ECRVVDMYPGPDAFTLSDDGDFLLAHLIGGCAVRVIPGVRAVEESVAQRNPFNAGRAQKARFKLGVSLCGSGYAGTRIHGEGLGFIRQSLSCPDKKSGGLLDVAAHAESLRETKKISTALEAQL